MRPLTDRQLDAWLAWWRANPEPESPPDFRSEQQRQDDAIKAQLAAVTADFWQDPEFVTLVDIGDQAVTVMLNLPPPLVLIRLEAIGLSFGACALVRAGRVELLTPTPRNVAALSCYALAFAVVELWRLARVAALLSGDRPGRGAIVIPDCLAALVAMIARIDPAAPALPRSLLKA
jgi:hypothetical protein